LLLTRLYILRDTTYVATATFDIGQYNDLVTITSIYYNVCNSASGVKGGAKRMWRKITVAIMLTILLSCQINSIASASANKPSLGTTYITVQWDPPEPE